MAAYFRLVNAASYTIRTKNKLYSFSGTKAVTVEDLNDIDVLRGKPDTVEECNSKGIPLFGAAPTRKQLATKEALTYVKLPKAKKPVAAPAASPPPPPPPSPAPVAKAPKAEEKVETDESAKASDKKLGKKNRAKK